jgi:hypothetical protein
MTGHGAERGAVSWGDAGEVFKVLGAVATAVAAWFAAITAYRGLQKWHQEKIWDSRRQAYGVILSELAVVERLCNNIDEATQELGVSEYFQSSYYPRDNNVWPSRFLPTT